MTSICSTTYNITVLVFIVTSLIILIFPKKRYAVLIYISIISMSLHNLFIKCNDSSSRNFSNRAELVNQSEDQFLNQNLSFFQRHNLDHINSINKQEQNLMKNVKNWYPVRNNLEFTELSENLRKPLSITNILAKNKVDKCLENYEVEELSSGIFDEKVWFIGEDGAEKNIFEETNENDKDHKELNFDRSNNVYKINKGDHILYRFEMIKFLGSGTYGNVYLMKDHARIDEDTDEIAKVAIKIMKKGSGGYSDFEYYAVKFIENHALEEDFPFVVGAYGVEKFRGHTIFIYELLGDSLHSFRYNLPGKDTNNIQQIMPTNILKTVAWDLLEGLAVLDRIELVHNDLKPTNILMTDLEYPILKIIDYGLGCYRYENYSNNTNEKIHMKCPKSYVVTRPFRSPEVILGLNYTSKSDMWSFGCIIGELYKKQILFSGDSEIDTLASMMEVLGVPPSDLLEKSFKRRVFLKAINYRGKRGDREINLVKEPYSSNLRKILGLENSKTNNNEQELFYDFIKKILTWKAEDRLSPLEAMNHLWLRDFANERFDGILNRTDYAYSS